MNALVIDFETTGKEAKLCRPIEVAATVMSADFKHHIDTYSSLIYADDYPEITDQIQELTNIQREDVIANGKHPANVLAAINSMAIAHGVQFIVAYNREFDETVYKEECARHKLYSPVGDIPWICAMRDVASNYNYKCWKLSHLALDYGVPIDPKDLHRAQADVFLTIDLLVAAGANAHTMYTYQKMPRHVLEAVTKKPWLDGGESTAKAKEKGYSWESPRGHAGMKYPKKWVKVVLETELENELNETAFQVRKVL